MRSWPGQIGFKVEACSSRQREASAEKLRAGPLGGRRRYVGISQSRRPWIIKRQITVSNSEIKSMDFLMFSTFLLDDQEK